MSKYTTEVRFICERYAGRTESAEYDSIDSIVEAAAPLIFEDFPIFDEEYRVPLEKKILRHYYTREICAETVGLWKLWLNNRLNEIMPYYNKLYQSALLELDPFNDVDYTIDHSGSSESNEVVDNEKDTVGRVEYTNDITNNRSDNNTRTYDSTQRVTGDITRTDDLNRALTSTTTGERNAESDSTSDTTTHTDFGGEGWEYFNDTPQGGVDRIDVQGLSNYLTNAKKTTNDTDTDVTDHNVGSFDQTENSQTDYSLSEDNTGTVTNSRDISSIRTGTTGDARTVSSAEHNVNVGDITNNETGNSTKDVNSTNAYIQRITGKRSNLSYAELLMKFRQTFLNIDAMIIKDLQDLFFNLW